MAEDLLIDLFHKLATATKEAHDDTEAAEWGTSSLARCPAAGYRMAESIKLISRRAVAAEREYLCEMDEDKSDFGRIRLWVGHEKLEKLGVPAAALDASALTRPHRFEEWLASAREEEDGVQPGPRVNRQWHPNQLTERDVAAAIKLTIPGEIAKHAESEGKKACARLRKSTATQETAEPESLAEAAGLLFPIATI